MSRMGHVRQSIGPSPTDGLPSDADTRCSAEHSREVLNSDRLVPMLTASQCLDGLDQLGLSGEARALFLADNAIRIFKL